MGTTSALELKSGRGATEASEQSVLHLGRRILAAGSIYGLTNFGLKGLNFLLLPVISRYLLPSDFGVVALAESIAAPVGMICGLGTATTLRRLYYDFGDDESARRSYIGTAIRFAAFSATAIIAVCCLAGPPLLARMDKSFAVPFFPLVAVAISSAGLSQIEQTQLSIFQVQNRPVSFALISAATFGFALILVPALVIWFHMGAAGVLTSRLTGTIVGVLITVYVSRSFITAPWHWLKLREQLRLGLPITVFEVVNLALIFADRIILQHYRSLGEVGIYSLAYSFGILMLMLTMSLSQVWSPLFFEASRAGQTEVLRKTSSSLMTSLVALACVGVVIARPVIHTFLDARYAAAAPLVPLILGAYLVNSFYYLFELQAFQQKRTGIVAAVTVFACAVNIGLNIWLIPEGGVFGAAIATMAAYVVQATAMYASVRHAIKGLYSSRIIVANLAIFFALVIAVEIRWHTVVTPCIFVAVFMVSIALLWPLGLNRTLSVVRSLVAQ